MLLDVGEAFQSLEFKQSSSSYPWSHQLSKPSDWIVCVAVASQQCVVILDSLTLKPMCDARCCFATVVSSINKCGSPSVSVDDQILNLSRSWILFLQVLQCLPNMETMKLSGIGWKSLFTLQSSNGTKTLQIMICVTGDSITRLLQHTRALCMVFF